MFSELTENLPGFAADATDLGECDSSDLIGDELRDMGRVSKAEKSNPEYPGW